MRIIAGEYKGRILTTVEDVRVRPLPDRVKEALFSSLGDEIVGASVLDLFAGSGAFGFEALSRGAAHCVFVEKDRDVHHHLQKNIKKLGCESRVELVCADAARVLEFWKRSGKTCDLVFLDPPYEQDLNAWLDRVAALSVLNENGLIVVKHDYKDRDKLGTLLPLTQQKRYGRVVLSYFGSRTAEE